MITSKTTPKLKMLAGYPEYFAGANGRIYEKTETSYRLVPGVWKDKVGYIRLSLPYTNEDNKTRFSCYVHLLVAESWLEKPELKDINVEHINGNKGDNRPENLKWKVKVEKGYIKRFALWLNTRDA